jgi:hypothetical protein
VGEAPIVLGGRRFHTADLERRTVLQHHYLAAVTREFGSPKRLPAEHEEPGAFVVEWHADVLASGKACQMLAAFLLPEGKTERDWSVAMADETRAFLEQLDTQDDREAVDTLVMECLIGFFRLALRPLVTSLSAMRAREAAAVAQEPMTAAH